MAQTATQAGIIVERRASASPWADYSWRVVGALPDAPALAEWTLLSRDGETLTFYAGSADIEAHAVETANYRDNLTSGRPSLWVVLRPSDSEPGMTLGLVTADPAEGEAMTEVGDLFVETVPMPATIASWLAEFVHTHHVEQAFIKRKRET